MDGSSKGPADQPPSTCAIFYSMEVAMQHTSGSYYRNPIVRVIAQISGVFDWRIGTFRTRLTLEVDEPHGRAVGPRRVTQQYLPHQNERLYRDSMGDAHSRGRSIALQSWW